MPYSEGSRSMNGLTIRIDCDPAVIPAAAYEWDIRYRHIIALTVMDCGDHIEIIGEPYAPMKDAEARWDESWREVFEHSHSNLAWETGITPMEVGNTARVARAQRIETPARLAGHDVHVVTSEMLEETVTARHADAWQPGRYYDGFYDPTIELPVVRVLPIALDTEYKRGVGKWPSEKLATAVPASAFLAAAYGLERHGGVMAYPHKARPVWKPLGATENVVLAAVVGGLDLQGEQPTEKKPAGVEYAWPTSVAAAQELGLTSTASVDTFRLFIAALEAERFGQPGDPQFEKVGEKWVIVRADNKWAWQLANQIARLFQSNPKAFVEWVYWNQGALLAAAEELAAPVVDAKPKGKTRPEATRKRPRIVVTWESAAALLDASVQTADLGGDPSLYSSASEYLLALNKGDRTQTIADIKELLK